VRVAVLLFVQVLLAEGKVQRVAVIDLDVHQCVFQCVRVAVLLFVQVLLAEGKVQRVAVIDLDVHQGDGTAVCLQVGCLRVGFLFSHSEADFEGHGC